MAWKSKTMGGGKLTLRIAFRTGSWNSEVFSDSDESCLCRPGPPKDAPRRLSVGPGRRHVCVAARTAHLLHSEDNEVWQPGQGLVLWKQACDTAIQRDRVADKEKREV